MINIKGFWGNTLRPVILSEQVIQLLPEETITFLSSWGLPTLEKFREQRIEFLNQLSGPLSEDAINNMNPRFEFDSDGISVIQFRGVTYVKIGQEYFSPIVLKTGTGEVCLLNGERPAQLPQELSFHEITFLNSSIERCVQFCTILIQSRSKMMSYLVQAIEKHPNLSKEEQRKIRHFAIDRVLEGIHEIERKFVEVDNVAMLVPNNRWHLLLSEFRDL